MTEGNIRIVMAGQDFSQDCGPLVKEFYPRLTAPEGFELKVDAGEEAFEICINGEVLLREEVVFEGTTPKERHRDYRNALLKGIYRVLSERTGCRLPWGVLTGVRPTKLVFERIGKGLAAHHTYLEEKYYVSPQKAALATRVAAKEYKLLNDIDYRDGYSLYVGFPFCPSICNYCSFGSHPIGRFEAYVEPYLDALEKEIEASAGLLPEKKLETVYFGGGTPTAVTAGQLQRIIRKVKSCFDMSGAVEFTVEAGRPDSITEEKLRMLKEEGVTRISINPQTMVQRTLDVIGRRHTVQQVKDAFALARRLGFDNINMDLIAGLTGENISDFEYTLSQIDELSPESLTVHTLAHKRAARLVTDADNEGEDGTDVALMVETAQKYAAAKGYEPYYLYRQKNMSENLENVGYARPGYEGIYNILIMEEQQMILALGAGASSKFVRPSAGRFERVENVHSVPDYIARIDEMIQRKADYVQNLRDKKEL